MIDRADANRSAVSIDPGVRTVLQASAVFASPECFWRPGWLILAGGRVLDLGPGRPPESPDRHLDLTGRLVTPALIDAHVHLGLAAPPDQCADEWFRGIRRQGLIGVRDGGDRRGPPWKSRPPQADGLVVASPGPALFAPGRYGSFIGRAVADRRDMAAAVRELADGGADFIKVLASGPVGVDAFGRVGPPQFTTDDLGHLVGLAAEAGLAVMAHANGPEAVGRCLAAGAATIEHGYFMGRRNLEHLADAGVTWVPTIAPMNVLSRNLEDPVHKANAARIVADQIDALARAKDLGAAVAAGTDAGAPGVELGPSLYEELGFFRQAGWDAADALTAACRGDLVQSPGLGRLTPAADAQVNIFNLAADGSADLSRPPDTVVVAGRVETGPENGSC